MCLPQTNSSNFVIAASRVDSCHARFMNEARTAEDENCILQERNGTIRLQTTKNIIPGERLQGRYGHAYMCKMKWPLALLLTMREKYRPTITKKADIKNGNKSLAAEEIKITLKIQNATFNSPQTNATAFLPTAPTTTV
jgi:hypothetical protein